MITAEKLRNLSIYSCNTINLPYTDTKRDRAKCSHKLSVLLRYYYSLFLSYIIVIIFVIIVIFVRNMFWVGQKWQ